MICITRIGGGKIITLAGLMYPFVNNADIGSGAVLGVLFIVINIIVFFIAERISKKKIKVENYLFGAT